MQNLQYRDGLDSSVGELMYLTVGFLSGQDHDSSVRK